MICPDNLEIFAAVARKPENLSVFTETFLK